MDYARQQANADQQYEEWVQNCDRLRYAVSVAGTSLLQERRAVLERNPPMEYAQQLTNEDFGEPRGARQMEDAQLLRDVEMGDPGNTHDVSWARHNRAICRPIGGLRVADVQPRQPVRPGEYGRGRMDALAYGARNSRTLRDALRPQHGAQRVGLY